MKEYKRIYWILAIAPILLAMGGFTELPADKIPKTKKDFTAVYMDQMDVLTECTQASIEGNTFLEGKRGEGILAIDFENIRSIAFRMNNHELTGQVKLTNGTETSLVVNKDKKAYGRAKFGAFQIKLADLKKMTIQVTSKSR